MRRILIACFVVFCVTAFADDAFPSMQYQNARVTGQSVQPYDRMDIVLESDGRLREFSRYGRLREMTFAADAGEDFKAYKNRLLRTLLGRFGTTAEPDTNQHFFRTSADPESWLFVDVYRDRYLVRYLEVAAYPPVVELDEAGAYRYSERLRDLGIEVPANEWIPEIRDFVITDAVYQRRDLLHIEAKTGGIDAEGERWQLKYAWRGKAQKTVRRFAVLHHYRDLVEGRGAEILLEDSTHIVFRQRDGETTTWGVFGCSDVAARLDLVREKPDIKKGLLSAEALKKALDAEGRVELKGIYFEFGKAELTLQSQEAIFVAAVMLKRYPDLKLEIEGHTDNIGGRAFNKALSQARADAVKAALAEQQIDGPRLHAVGYGFERPVASNDDDAGRAANRRVELRHTGGGMQKVSIDAGFFMPLKHADKVSQKASLYDTIAFRLPAAASSKPKTLKVSGDAVSLRYVFFKNGLRDRSISAYEILKAMEKMIALLDGEVISKSKDRLEFMIRKGAGEYDLYGTVEAGMGAYTIYTIRGERLLDPEAAKKAEQKSENK